MREGGREGGRVGRQASGKEGMKESRKEIQCIPAISIQRVTLLFPTVMSTPRHHSFY